TSAPPAVSGATGHPDAGTPVPPDNPQAPRPVVSGATGYPDAGPPVPPDNPKAPHGRVRRDWLPGRRSTSSAGQPTCAPPVVSGATGHPDNPPSNRVDVDHSLRSPTRLIWGWKVGLNAMKQPLQVRFHEVKCSESVREHIERKAAALAVHERVSGCRV